MDDPTSTRPASPDKLPRAARALGLVSLLLAGGWLLAAWWICERYILRRAAEAQIAMLFLGGSTDSTGLVRLEVVATTCYAWLGLMAIVAASLLVAGLLALVGSRRAHAAHRFAAVLVIASTVGTLIGLAVLIQQGGFPATLKPLFYVLVVLVQSAYGWFLLIALPRIYAACSPQPMP